MPQYNPNPNVPVGFIGNQQQHTFQKSVTKPQIQMQQQQTFQKSVTKPQIQMQQQQTFQKPQPMQQQPSKHFLFYQPSCTDSGEFLKLLDFSPSLKQLFIFVNILIPNQRIPDKVQFTPTIITVPDYTMYGPDDAFKWLQREVIKENQSRQQPSMQSTQPTMQSTQPTIGARVNAPVYNPGGGAGSGPGGQPPNMRSTPAGKEPSQNFNTYNSNRDGGIRPFMSDMDSGKGGGFKYLDTDQPPPLNYAHIPQENNQNGQQNQQQKPAFLTQQQGRPRKLEDAKYNNYLAQRDADPYIQQSMPRTF